MSPHSGAFTIASHGLAIEGPPSRAGADRHVRRFPIPDAAAASAPVKPHLDRPINVRLVLILLAVLAGGLFYMAFSIYTDVSETGGRPTTIVPFLLLRVAMLIA